MFGLFEMLCINNDIASFCYYLSPKKRTMQTHNVLVDVDHMRTPYTGLYFYSRSLYTHLLAAGATDLDFRYYARSRVQDAALGQNRITLRWWHKAHFQPKNIDLWHANYQLTRYDVSAPKKVITVHDLNFLYEKKSPAKRKKRLAALQKKMDTYDRVVTISEFVKQDLLRNVEVDEKKVQVIHNGVLLDHYPEHDEPTYRPKKPFLFGVATILPKKNFHSLLPMLAEIEDMELVLAGIHPRREYIEYFTKEVAKYSLQDRVKLVGAVSQQDKYWYMKHCRGFVFPSTAEGFGIPVIEAMQLGKPVFLSTHTSLPEIGGEYAYYFSDFDPARMLKTLTNGLTDYDSDASKKRLIEEWGARFSWEKTATQYISVYKDVLEL